MVHTSLLRHFELQAKSNDSNIKKKKETIERVQ